jgi:hypothetical protein
VEFLLSVLCGQWSRSSLWHHHHCRGYFGPASNTSAHRPPPSVCHLLVPCPVPSEATTMIPLMEPCPDPGCVRLLVSGERYTTVAALQSPVIAASIMASPRIHVPCVRASIDARLTPLAACLALPYASRRSAFVLSTPPAPGLAHLSLPRARSQRSECKVPPRMACMLRAYRLLCVACVREGGQTARKTFQDSDQCRCRAPGRGSDQS